ncbi:Alpha/Beta hydrolase protein [Morchella snyderi]|nr:Alpha/Beta hydrolase protein [Morchella snyderi]
MPEARTQQSPLASGRGAETQGTASADAGKPGIRLPNNLFPLGYKEGFSQWWTAVSPAAAEAAVLGFLPFNKKPLPALTPSDGNAAATASPPSADPHGPRECASNMVPLSGKNRIINEFSVTRTGEGEPKHHLVMLHGYGAGLGFFYRNYDMLSRRAGWKLWSLDLLGYGRSSRPPFCISSKGTEGKITEAEDWFVDALEEWRKVRGIERFTLLGHSFGGYLSVRYALKYKERVNKLILVSPVGVPEDPYAVREDLPDAEAKSNLQDEYMQTQEEATRSNPNIPDTLKVPHDPGNNVHSHSTTDLPSSSSSSSSPATPASSRPAGKPNAKPRRPLPKWLVYLWEANISPFSIIRWSGPLGPRLVSGWTSRRFSQLPGEESTALHDYAYSLFRQRGSGEYALAYVLAPGAHARRPLIWAAQKLAGTPSVWMYGEMDWMDVAGGFAAEEKIRGTPLPEERAAGYVGGEEWRGEKKERGGEAKVQIVKNAGHHLYLDGWEEFNELVGEEMRDVEARERQQQ